MDTGRFVVFAAVGLLWVVALGVLGDIWTLLPVVAVVVILGSLVLALHTPRVVLRVVVPWVLVVAVATVVFAGLGPVWAAAAMGVLYGSLAFGAWVTPSYVVLHFARAATPVLPD